MEQDQVTLPSEGFTRPKVIHKAFGIGLSTFWSLVAANKFPAGIKLSPRITVWDVADVRRWMEEQKK